MPTTISIPGELADELYELKGRGESYADVIRRLKRQAEAAESGGTDDAVGESPTEPGHAPTPTPDATRDAPAGAHADEDFSSVVDTVADEVLPGGGVKLEERREAFQAVVDYLRENGTATPADFRDDVYPDHTARYTDGKNPARSWWKNAMYPALSELADRTDEVAPADQSGEWFWQGDE